MVLIMAKEDVESHNGKIMLCRNLSMIGECNNTGQIGFVKV